VRVLWLEARQRRWWVKNWGRELSRDRGVEESWRRDCEVSMFVIDYGINIVTGNYSYFINFDFTAKDPTRDWFWTCAGSRCSRSKAGRRRRMMLKASTLQEYRGCKADVKTHNQDHSVRLCGPESGQTRVVRNSWVIIRCKITGNWRDAR
jgi:hypothetical protein